MDRQQLLTLAALLTLASGCGDAQSTARPRAHFAQAEYSLTESAEPLRIGVRLDTPAKQELRLHLRFGGTASIDRDYDAPAEVVFAPGSKEATIVIQPKKDGEAECAETAWIELADAEGARTRVSIALEDEDILARRVRVGGKGNPRGVAEVAPKLNDGDVVEIAEGFYDGDVAVLSTNDLVLCGLGKGPRIDASGKSAEGKGIWVIKGERARVENIHFTGAKVSDRNGAGIRFEGRDLTVRHCRFTGNENGILTGEKSDSTVTIEHSEFTRNGAGDGYTHNIYIGKIGRLNARFNIFREAVIGHNVKTRAAESVIEYNQIVNDKSGRASMEVDFSNGGVGVLVGNVIQQGTEAENLVLVSYGPEGMPYTRNVLLMASNTFVNDRTNSIFVRVPDGRDCLGMNNVFAGRGEFKCKDWRKENNVEVKNGFLDRAGFDYRIRANAEAANFARPVSDDYGFNLTPRYEIDRDGWVRKRVTRGLADAGAYEAGDP